MSIYGTYGKYRRLDGTNRFSDMQAAPPTSLLTLGATAAGDMTDYRWLLAWSDQVYAIGIMVTTLLVYDTATALEVLEWDYRPTFGSDTGRVEIGRLQISDTLSLAVGNITLVEVQRTNAFLKPGGEVIMKRVTRATGGGGLAGVYTPFALLEEHPESIPNMPNVRLSTFAQVV